MSRIGKKSILIPANVEVKIDGMTVLVKGPKGELSFKVAPQIEVEKKEDKIFISINIETKLAKSLWGLSRVMIFNMIKGVTDGFEKRLEIQGIGFKAAIEGENLVLAVGFSHPVKVQVPKSLKVSVEKNIIIISGIDKELVGQYAANIRKIKPPEPYKGKGIRYVGEVVRRKVGKKVATTTG